MSDSEQAPLPNTQKGPLNVVVGVNAEPGRETITARQAGGIQDLKLPVSPSKRPVAKCLQNLAKAINLALQSDFIETELDRVYKAARVRTGRVEILHKDYIGLGEGVSAKIGKSIKSFQLTLQGPDPASPEGKDFHDRNSSKPIAGIVNLIGRKLNFLQEFEDKVPTLVEQMLDRLEASNVIIGWSREEWKIETQIIGLDVIITPVEAVPATESP